MKRILSLILCVFMTLSLETAVLGADEITIYVNGSVVRSEVKPVILNGNTLIPIRPVAEAMGCTVTWEAAEKGIKIVSDNITVGMVVDYGIIYIDIKGSGSTTAQPLTVPPQIINGSTYIPMRAMVEALGGEVSWDGNTKTIKITYNSGSAQNNYTSEEGTGKSFFSVDDDEGTYVGEMSNGLENGKGTMTWSSGDVYEGEFKDGYRNGIGTYTWSSGNVYEGEWVDGEMDGRGKYTYNNGDVYEGEWVNGEKNGKGKYTYNYGAVYEGEFKDGYFNGTGTMTYTNGNVYEGEWLNGERSGKGKLTYAAGACYEGEWLNDEWNGEGKYTYADGTVKEGTWKDGKFVGRFSVYGSISEAEVEPLCCR